MMNNVTIFHKDYCPYCKAAKQLLTKLGIEYNDIEVTNNPIEFNNMVKLSGRKTVPQIFIGERHIGGYDDLRTHVINNTLSLSLV